MCREAQTQVTVFNFCNARLEMTGDDSYIKAATIINEVNTKI